MLHHHVCSAHHTLYDSLLTSLRTPPFRAGLAVGAENNMDVELLPQREVIPEPGAAVHAAAMETPAACLPSYAKGVLVNPKAVQNSSPVDDDAPADAAGAHAGASEVAHAPLKAPAVLPDALPAGAGAGQPTTAPVSRAMVAVAASDAAGNSGLHASAAGAKHSAGAAATAIADDAARAPSEPAARIPRANVDVAVVQSLAGAPAARAGTAFYITGDMANAEAPLALLPIGAASVFAPPFAPKINRMLSLGGDAPEALFGTPSAILLGTPAAPAPLGLPHGMLPGGCWLCFLVEL